MYSALGKCCHYRRGSKKTARRILHVMNAYHSYKEVKLRGLCTVKCFSVLSVYVQMTSL